MFNADEARKKALENLKILNKDNEDWLIKTIEQNIEWAIKNGSLFFTFDLDLFDNRYSDESLDFVKSYFKELGYQINFVVRFDSAPKLIIQVEFQ